MSNENIENQNDNENVEDLKAQVEGSDVQSDNTPDDDTVEKWKHFARVWEERAKSNEEAAKKLNELEEATKSDIQKAKERAEKAENELKAAKHKILVTSIASEFSLSSEDTNLFLTGNDEDTLRAQAEALAKKNVTDNNNNNNINLPIKGISTRDTGEVISEEQEFFRRMLGKA